MFYLSEMKDPGRIKASYKSLEGISINGFIVTSVPSSVPIDESDFREFEGDINPPPHLTRDAVLYQKYEGLLTQNPFFDNNHYETLGDSSNFDLSETRGAIGRHHYWLNPTMNGINGSVQTNVITLPSNSNTFRIHWDVYRLERVTENDDSSGGGITFLRYIEEDPNLLEASFTATAPDPLVSAPYMKTIEVDEGSSFVLRLENPTADRLYLGGFGILY